MEGSSTLCKLGFEGLFDILVLRLYLLVDHSAWRAAEKFLCRVLWFSSSITHLGAILFLHLSSLTFCALHLLFIIYAYALESSSGLLHFIYSYFALS